MAVAALRRIGLLIAAGNDLLDAPAGPLIGGLRWSRSGNSEAAGAGRFGKLAPPNVVEPHQRAPHRRRKPHASSRLPVSNAVRVPYPTSVACERRRERTYGG